MRLRLILLFHLFLLTNLFAQWFWQNPYPQGNNLNDISMINDKVGFAVGDLGTILKTIDSGETWTMINSGTKEKLY